MQHQWITMDALCGVLTIPKLAQASTGDVGITIEILVVRQFPNAVGQHWVNNETRWDEDEMIVDVHTIVNERRATDPP